MTTALSVNLNKVALIRNTRHLGIPSVTRAASLCLSAGAHGITIHPRPDARHIRSSDAYELDQLLKQWPDREFNIEGNPFHNMMEFVEKIKPHQVTFVPDGQDQFTSDHGWQFPDDAQRLIPVIAKAKSFGSRVSLFMDVDASAMKWAKQVGADRVELYTELYAKAHGTSRQTHVLRQFAHAAQAAQEQGLEVNAGHDLNLLNLKDFLTAVVGVKEVSIGHALISDALEIGYQKTIQSYLDCMPAS
ncbi:MAG: pyridoxine 5'-phosphate synthase [Limnohabitans sp.]|nr:pyridoxine 5'-phosphate synthase [Limnohabitans sp.]